MANKTYSEIAGKLQKFSRACYDKDGSYSYACGVFQTMLAAAMAKSSPEDQAWAIKLLEDLTTFEETGKLSKQFS